MIGLSLRNLLRERTRLAISVGGVAFAVALIVLVRGLLVAYQSRVADYFEGVQADVWVLQSGTADFFHSFSLLPTDVRSELATVPDIANTEPYVARLVALDIGDRDAVLYLVGFEPGDPVTGPRHLASGTTDIASDEIIIDEVFARRYGVDEGDTLTLEGRALTVAGISTGGDLVMFQYAFADLDTTREILEFGTIDNAVLVELVDGADPTEVAAAIETNPGLQARTTRSVIEVNQGVINEGFVPVIRVILAIGFVVGVAVVGLTIYSSVIERRREFGVLKALGARTRHLLVVIVVQSLIATAIGYALGLVLAYAARWASQRWVPQFITELHSTDLAWVAVATTVMALAAATLPLVRVSRIDPAEVFRA